MRNIARPAGTEFHYQIFADDAISTVKLGEEDVIAVILDNDTNGDIVEWITRETYWETVVNVATWGDIMVYLDTEADHENIKLALRERELYADCFGTEGN